MALVIPANSRANHIARLTNNAPINGDYTCTFWAKRTSQRLTAYRVFWSAQNAAYDEWIGLFTDASVSADENVLLNSDDGGGVPVSTSTQFAEEDRWIPYAYRRTGNLHEFIMLGIVIDDFTLDLTATTIDEQRVGGDDFSNNANSSGQFMLLREWDTALTLAELIAEWNSPTVIKTANLWSNCPLINNADDISGNARHYSAVGSVTYATSPTPVPLTNTTSGTAYEITGALPQERVQIVHDGTITQDVWFKRTSVSADGNELGFYAWGGLTGPSSYFPQINPYLSPDFVSSILGIGVLNKPIQIPITEGNDYYFRVLETSYNPVVAEPTPAVLYVILQAAPLTAPVTGDIYVNDDTTGFPSVVLSSATDYLVKRFYPNIPAGEAGDILANGNFLLDDIDTNDYKLFDVNSNLLITYSSYSTFGYVIRTHKPTNTIYIAEVRNSLSADLTLKNYDQSGTELSSITLTGITRTEGIAVNDDQSILYLTRNFNNQPIRRFNLNTLTVMSDLVAGVPNYRSQDILFIDGHIIVGYTKLSGGTDYMIRRYDETGALINTYTLTAYIGASASFAPRLAYALDNPTSFWTYIQRAELGNGIGWARFLNIRISDGVILTNRLHSPFEFGGGTEEATEPTFPPPGYFGPSESCPFFILPTGATNSIQVIKVTVPSSATQSFDYTTTGGLSPSTFSLAHGENIIFDDLANGTYGVTETEIAGWTTTYEVSNGDPHDAIVLSGGTNVIVTVTNTQTYRDRSGIYKIVPGKRNDTLWIEEGTSTEDVMIPNPYARFPFVGE